MKAADASDPVGQMTENLTSSRRPPGPPSRRQLKKQSDAKIAEGKKALADAGLAGASYAFADGYVVPTRSPSGPFTSGSLVGGVNESSALKNDWSVQG